MVSVLIFFFFPREAHGTFAENQKCHAIRKAYQVVLIPKYTWSSLWITLILIFTHCVASGCNSHDKYWTAVERIQQLWTGIQVASSLTQLKWYSCMVGLMLWSVMDSRHLCFGTHRPWTRRQPRNTWRVWVGSMWMPSGRLLSMRISQGV